MSETKKSNIDFEDAAHEYGGEPDIGQLQEWEHDGGCEALDGCWVEPDGHCKHGYPSWLIYMGMI